MSGDIFHEHIKKLLDCNFFSNCARDYYTPRKLPRTSHTLNICILRLLFLLPLYFVYLNTITPFSTVSTLIMTWVLRTKEFNVTLRANLVSCACQMHERTSFRRTIFSKGWPTMAVSSCRDNIWPEWRGPPATADLIAPCLYRNKELTGIAQKNLI